MMSDIISRLPKNLQSMAKLRITCRTELERIFPQARIFITLPEDKEIIGGETIIFRAFIKRDSSSLDLRGDSLKAILEQAIKHQV